MTAATGSPTALRFGAFRLDLRSGELSRSGASIALRPKATLVLLELVRHVNQLVPRERLLHVGWGDAHVNEDAALHGVIREIRDALEDSASHPTFVATVHRRGYRFIAAVEPCESTGVGTEKPRAGIAPAPGESRATRARRYTGIAAVLTLALVPSAYLMLSGPRQTAPVETPIHVLRARHILTRSGVDAASRSASRLRAAIRDDAESVLAWSGLAVAEFRLGRFESARSAAERALELDPQDIDAIRVLGRLALMHGEILEAEAHLLLALELNEASGESHLAWGAFLAAAGHPTGGINEAVAARRLLADTAPARADLARYLFHAGQLERAVQEARRLYDERPDADDRIRLDVLDTLQAAAWSLGDTETARAAAGECAGIMRSPPDVGSAMRAQPAELAAELAIRRCLAAHVEQAPGNASHRLRAALLYAQLGHVVEATEQLERILVSDAHTSLPTLAVDLMDPRLKGLARSAALTALRMRFTRPDNP